MEHGGILEADYLESAPRTHSKVEVVLVLPELHTSFYFCRPNAHEALNSMARLHQKMDS